ncbi:MAG: N-acetyltransferase [Verrucomicrobiales bacterium]|nr:N-acetyltransferase [Verrucomicrobiales bacterium]
MIRPDSKIVVRSESDADADGIRRVLVAAFEGKTEADLVEALRKNGALIVSLVACTNREIVGHIGFSPMHTDGQPDRDDMLGLAPLAVLPQWQRRGIGSTLTQRGLDECRNRAVRTVCVLGAPEFYGRFGFVPAHTRGLRSAFKSPPDAFQVLALGDDPLVRALAGLIHYRPEFDSFL